MELRLPVDFERLPEFRMLTQSLGQHRTKGTKPDVEAATQREVECAASFLWVRLWVELAYLAQSTNRPGVLTKSGAALFEQSLDPLFGEGCEPVSMLLQSGVLAPSGEEFHCDRFARLNGHLAGNFKSRELKGAVSSALERNRFNIAREANAQGMLLPQEIFKDRKGNVLEASEANRCMIVIKTIDNCLKIPGRTKQQYTEGMIADAAAASKEKTPEQLKSFYVWLSLNRDRALVPKTTEQVLSEFGRLFEVSQS